MHAHIHIPCNIERLARQGQMLRGEVQLLNKHTRVLYTLRMTPSVGKCFCFLPDLMSYFLRGPVVIVTVHNQDGIKTVRLWYSTTCVAPKS